MSKKLKEYTMPKYVTCEGCQYRKDIDMLGHCFCEHSRIRSIVIVKYLKPCIYKDGENEQEKRLLNPGL